MTYNNIKNAALNLFSRKGFEGTTIKDIASKAGLKPSSVYSHFTSKEEIFMIIWSECIQNTLNGLRDLITKSERENEIDGEKLLFTFYIRVVEYFFKNREEYLFLKQATFFTRNDNISNSHFSKGFLDNDDYKKYFGKFFTELKDNGRIKEYDNEDLIFSYIGIMIAYLEQALIYNIVFDKHTIQRNWDIFWNGIKK